jgi:uncharacterized membrane protein
MNALSTAEPSKALDPSQVTYTHIIYGLHALAVLIGLTASATIVGTFIWSVPSIIAVIMNYVRQSEVKGTILESHFTWQIRTFWYTVLWTVIVAAVSAVLLIVLIGIATWIVGFAALGVWVLYRVVRGWLALREMRPMYT